MLNFIVTLVFIFLIIIFGILKSVWAGFVFFALFGFIAICVYWICVVIISYINNYHKNIDERYKLYCANLINNSTLTLQDIMNQNEIYFAKFKKSLYKEKIFEIGKILLLVSLIIVSVGILFTT